MLSPTRLLLVLLGAGSCFAAQPKHQGAEKAASGSPDPKQWLDSFTTKYSETYRLSYEANFQYSTNITNDTLAKKVEASLESKKILIAGAEEAYGLFNGTAIKDEKDSRAMDDLLDSRSKTTDQERLEMEELENRLYERYSTVRICPPNLTDTCSDDEKIPLSPTIEEIMRDSRNETELKLVWKRWRDVAGKPSKSDFFTIIRKSNEYQRRLGRKSMREDWLKSYVDDAPGFLGELWVLFKELLPLYEDMHAYVRFKLNQFYGDLVPLNGTIPAHLLGNMWAQEWSNIYDLVEPFPGNYTRPSVTEIMVSKNWTVQKMFDAAEGFFTSVGMPSLPPKFWKNSMFVKPPDREVVCHASAWDVNYQDKRIKMCTQINVEDLGTVHHELGHIYYYLAYENQTLWLQEGANPGFHEAVGDTIYLSSNQDEYHRMLGLLPENFVSSDEEHINSLMKKALAGIMFFPYGYLLDLWRWDMFDETVPENVANQHYWSLRKKYQGVHAPVSRSADDFDPPAKYHVSGFVPYIRYYVARFLQYQFHDTLCQNVTMDDDDISKCTIYGNQNAGDRLWEMLKLGSSKPWPEALEAITGSRKMSARSVLKFYGALRKWLRAENVKNGVCIGWGSGWPKDVKLNQPRC